MRTSRRDLIRLSAAAAVSCLAPGSSTAGPRRAPAQTRAEAARRAYLTEEPLLTRRLLSDHVDTAFAVDGGRRAGSASLRLRRLADLPSAQTSGLTGSDLCFSALFGGPLSVPLPQRTYRLRHAALGTFSVFLVPVGRPARVRLYEAVCNRLEA
jgi:hypothetical protein